MIVIHSRIDFRAATRWMIWTVWFGTPAWFALTTTAAESQLGQAAAIPLWQQGVSRWTGAGYSQVPNTPSFSNDSVAATSEAIAQVSNEVPAPPSPVPYTVPYIPSIQTLSSSPLLMPSTQDRIAAQSTAPSLVGPSLAEPQVSSDPSAVPLTDWSDLPPIGQGLATELPQPLSEPTFTPPSSDPLANQPITMEPLPLEQEVIHWYQYPMRWMQGWNSHAEFGLDGSSGNAETLALQTGLEMKRKTDDYTLALDVDYRVASSRDVTTEDNGRFNVDYDRMINETPWSLFGKYGMEWDKFKAFDLRVNINGGVGYHWIRTDDTTLVTRFGAGASREIGAPIDEWTPEAVFGLEAERQLTRRQKLKAKVDYFPAWDDFADYRLVSDFSWEILLDGSENLSLKLAATDRYDSTPQGAKNNDLYYSLLLLYKF
ncbi:hypothetical protein Poly41_10830 [Novipirellula artificiosorum]|uniref:Mucin-like protein n=2 Tax=Novipirellula artificiosorum TaxID=2528016 RepID=A0A5C6E1J5_9BACT|nr:hypothetical protein Poly41_10830 [Novipirellula artificiosorum]